MIVTSMRTFCALVHRDMTVFWPTLWNRFINGGIWVVLTIGVFQYILLPQMGLQSNFAVFMACAGIMSWGFFEVMGNVATMVGDLTGSKAISYDLTLPLPQWLVFTRIAVTNGLQAMAIAFFMLPLSKIVLWNQFSLGHMSFYKYISIFIAGNAFYGFFSLWLSSMTKNLDHLNDIWMRVVFPLWWIGGYQFSWYNVYAVSPVCAYFCLLNPLMYIFEGIRAAVLGQEGYLDFWISLCAVIFFTVLVGYIGTKKFMHRLDCL